jgi:hypothetical protein
MEEYQITCPQCGLVNNILADACVQCGIIFVKDPAMKAAAAALDDEKRKSIEAAEAILDETQPPPDTDTPNQKKIRRPDPHEDTVEVRVPEPEEIPPLEVESSASPSPEPEAKKETQDAKIELDAIETSIEAVTEPHDPESLIPGEITADEWVKPDDAEMAEGPIVSSDDPQKVAEASAETENAGLAGEKSPDSKADDVAAKKYESTPLTADSSTADMPNPESEPKPSTSDFSAQTDAFEQKWAEPIDADAKSTPKDETQPEKLEIQLETPSEVKPDEHAAVKAETHLDAPAAQEKAAKRDDVEGQAKLETQEARKEALIKQQEALLKAEARKKEEAAQTKAAASKKKKLAKAKAEALKKQKAAQAKAEALKKKKAARIRALALKKKRADQATADALKKQKAAQTRAEESAENVEVAAAGHGNYAKLLGLLKRYEGKAIGINYDNSAEIKEAELVAANEEFFSVMVKEKKIQYSYPLKTILTIVEGEQGVETGEDDKKARFDAVIKVYPLALF